MALKTNVTASILLTLIMLLSIGMNPVNVWDSDNDDRTNDTDRTVIDYSALMEESHEMAWGVSARALTGEQKFLVIDAKWPDHSNSRWTTNELDDVFDVTLSDFYADASHNQITIEGDVFAITMPEDSDQYLKARSNGRNTYDTQDVVNDALEAVDSSIDMNDYPNRKVIVVLNGPYFNGVYSSTSTGSILDENNGNWKLILVSENDGNGGSFMGDDWSAGYTTPYPDRDAEDHNRTWGRIAHEIGHMLGLHHTTKSYANGYALLASLYPGQLTGYSMRAAVDWLPNSRVYQPAAGTIDETVFVYPLEMGNIGEQYQMIKIPITDQKYYLIEVRSRVLADKYMHCSLMDDANSDTIFQAGECIEWGFTGLSLPDEGVLVSFVDLTLPTTGQDAQAVTIDLDGDGSQDSLLKSGDKLVIDLDGKDASIDVVGVQPNGAYEFKVSYEISDLTPPDIWMPANPPWKVAEIWVDSPLNGMGMYQYHDGDPTIPNEGNGDNPALGRQNSICAKVRNTGQLPSNSVPVTFKWKTHNMGLPSDSYSEVGTVNTASIPGGSYEVVCVTNWIPEVEGIEYDPGNPIVSLHACIRVEVGLSVDDPNTATDETETNTGNNEAQENIGHFETTSSSPFSPIDLTFTVGNPNTHATWIWIEVSNVPNNWQYLLAWEDDTIPAGGEVSNSITITPPATMTGSEMRLIHDIEITGYFYRAEPDGSTHVAELGSVIASSSAAEKSYTSLSSPMCSPELTGECTSTGAVDGGLIGDPVTVIFTSPDGIEHLVTSFIEDQTGLFTSTIFTGTVTDEPDGEWTAVAVYLGGPQVEASFSSSESFEVEYRGDTSIPDDRTNIIANESHTFTDFIENGEPGSSVVIKFISPKSKVFPIEVIISDEGTFSVYFSPTEAGEWTIKYTYGGNEVSSTFEVEEEKKEGSGIPSVGFISALSMVALAATLIRRRRID
jgi:M6 family metalloprotease-like protein